MPRIRTVKPEFFTHYELYLAEEEIDFKLPLRLSYAGLWTCADKEGRFKWQPQQLKLNIIPYDKVSFDDVLHILFQKKFIIKYEVEGRIYGCIPSFPEHQRFTGKEAQMESKLPCPPGWEASGKQPGSIGETTGKTGVQPGEINYPKNTGEASGKQPGSIGETTVKILPSDNTLDSLIDTPSSDYVLGSNGEASGKQPGSIGETFGNPGKEWIKGREGGKEREGKGVWGKPFSSPFDQKKIIQRMMDVWISKFPNHRKIENLDSPALFEILNFIISGSGKQIGFLTNADEDAIIVAFESISDEVAKSSFWRTKALGSISKNVQEFYNKIKNPENAAAAKSRQSKIDDQKLKDKLADRDPRRKQGGG